MSSNLAAPTIFQYEKQMLTFFSFTKKQPLYVSLLANLLKPVWCVRYQSANLPILKIGNGE